MEFLFVRCSLKTATVFANKFSYRVFQVVSTHCSSNKKNPFLTHTYIYESINDLLIHIYITCLS